MPIPADTLFSDNVLTHLFKPESGYYVQRRYIVAWYFVAIKTLAPGVIRTRTFRFPSSEATLYITCAVSSHARGYHVSLAPAGREF